MCDFEVINDLHTTAAAKMVGRQDSDKKHLQVVLLYIICRFGVRLNI